MGAQTLDVIQQGAFDNLLACYSLLIGGHSGCPMSAGTSQSIDLATGRWEWPL